MDTTETHPEPTIDYGLYDRQVRTLGADAMKRLTKAHVLLIGCGGLGVEVAKNLILTGVGSLTILDDTVAALADIGSQFYITEEDVAAKKSRSQASVEKLAELNAYVTVKTVTGPLSTIDISKYQVVISTNGDLQTDLELNERCRAASKAHLSANRKAHHLFDRVGFVSAESRGAFAKIFCDFGERPFISSDPTGEPLASYPIVGISQDNPCVVTLSESSKLSLETGDFIQISEVIGMEELQTHPHKITVLSPWSFSIPIDSSKLKPYVRAGIVTEVRQPKATEFLSYRDSLARPRLMELDFGKPEQPLQLHMAFAAANEFARGNSGQLPALHDTEHAAALLKFAVQLNEQLKLVQKVDDKLLSLFSRTIRGELPQLNAVIGAISAQEALKCISSKFTPMHQFLYLDAVEILPDYTASTYSPVEFVPEGNRYDRQVSLLGRTLMQQLHALKYFLVGAGAIGCEILKNWAMMGVGCGAKGGVHVTDMDTIEKSNLNRQFLFRQKDVGRPKSATAAEAVKKMNASMHVSSATNRVGADTEHIYHAGFYENIDGVCNALDNVEARRYVDGRCVMFCKSLLESGTLGSKGNVQVVVPHLTESYASSSDPPEASIPVCTLHNFPYRIEHTIAYARDKLFEGLFKTRVDNVNAYLSNEQFIAQLAAKHHSAADQVEILQTVRSCLVEKPSDFRDCILWARRKFEEFFSSDIKQLLHNFPPDSLNSSGAPFWSGIKRAPTPLKFDVDNGAHLDFIVAAANLQAYVYKLPQQRDKELIRDVLIGSETSAPIDVFVPKKVKISVDESAEKAAVYENAEEELARILSDIPPRSKLPADFRLQPADFEKDDDTNFHIDFITAASNLRAMNYKIQSADRHQTKGIAGKIIPAMITTTSVVAGLVCIEMVKLLQRRPLESYRNAFVNLALPLVCFSEPVAPPRLEIRPGEKFTLWDSYLVEGDLTTHQLMEHMKEKYRLVVISLACKATLLYASFNPQYQSPDRLESKVSKLYLKLSNTKSFPKDQKTLLIDAMCKRLEDNVSLDECPPIRLKFKA